MQIFGKITLRDMRAARSKHDYELSRRKPCDFYLFVCHIFRLQSLSKTYIRTKTAIPPTEERSAFYEKKQGIFSDSE